MKEIFSTGSAFAALKEDGSVVTWGASSGGGNYTYGGDDDGNSITAAKAGVLSSGVVKIFSTQGAFAALKEDGSVVTWGASNNGGDSSTLTVGNLDPKSATNPGVVKIFSTDSIGIDNNGSAFAALKEDGSVVTWGKAAYDDDDHHYDYGADSSAVQADLKASVTVIPSTTP